MISAKVTKLPHIGKPDSILTQVKSHEVFTQAIPRDVVVKPDIIPLWIIVLAAVAGTAILLFLAYLLYKVTTTEYILLLYYYNSQDLYKISRVVELFFFFLVGNRAVVTANLMLQCIDRFEVLIFTFNQTIILHKSLTPCQSFTRLVE